MRIASAALIFLVSFALSARADQDVKQVEIEARLAEVNSDYGRDIGVDFDTHHAQTDDILRHTDAKLQLTSAVKQDGAFGDDIGVRKIQPVPRTVPLTSAAPTNPPAAFKVVPKISPNGNVIMDAHPEVTELPAAAVPKVETVARVPDSQTAVLGGLKTTEIGTKKNSVPVLSKIPILGRLFRHEDKTQEKKDLLVVIKPTLIQASENSD